ncbi:hypothetical protein HRJ35_13660 [Shewanella oneidensis MR-1]|nr:hypothetical protein [Shewanella oneidensis]MDX5995898.1 hypothetical protein [Shewanella oneidensis]QKG96946.1 hypothetical protein HRJ35_13660 [Shewanella oneidensis MR-1]
MSIKNRPTSQTVKELRIIAEISTNHKDLDPAHTVFINLCRYNSRTIQPL